MPRVYKPSTKKPYKKYDPDLIKQAVKELGKRKAELSTVAKKYDINISVLYRHSTKVMKKQGGQIALSEEVEGLLIDYINKCAELNYPMSAMELRYIIKMYLDKAGSKIKKFKDNLPGPDFIYGFLKRNKDKVHNRNIKIIKGAHVKFAPDTMTGVFEAFENFLNGIPPTKFTDNSGPTQSLVKCVCKYPERKLRSTRASVSMNTTKQCRKRKINVVAGERVGSAIDEIEVTKNVEPDTSDPEKSSFADRAIRSPVEEIKKCDGKAVEKKILRVYKGKGVGKKTKNLKVDTVEVNIEGTDSIRNDASERINNINEEKDAKIEEVIEKGRDKNARQDEINVICSEVENNSLQSQSLKIQPMPMLFVDCETHDEIVDLSDIKYITENKVHNAKTDDCEENKNNNVEIISERVLENINIRKNIQEDSEVVPLLNRFILPMRTYTNKRRNE